MSELSCICRGRVVPRDTEHDDHCWRAQVKDARRAERERCAKVVERSANSLEATVWGLDPEAIAARIRALGDE